eukprot:707962_1
MGQCCESNAHVSTHERMSRAQSQASFSPSESVSSFADVVPPSHPPKGDYSPDSTFAAQREEKSRVQRNPFKIIFLGAAESGKSTIYRHIEMRHGSSITEDYRRKFTDLVHQNTIEAIQTLVMRSTDLPRELECVISIENEEIAQHICNLRDCDVEVTPTVAKIIDILWHDPGIQRTYLNRSHFQSLDSTRYFMERARDMCAPDYIPSVADILRVRMKTNGINESTVVVDGIEYKLFDVAGQRVERRKWVKAFKDVSAVFFVVAISEYDQLCFEDSSAKRLEEALRVFESICNAQWFENVPIVVIMNKIDLFIEKLTVSRIPLSDHYPEYDGPDYNVESASAWIWEQFVSRNRSANAHLMRHHFVSATDPNSDTIG